MASNNVKEQKKPGAGKFFKSIKSEVKKVTWPSRKDVWQYTIVVLFMVLFMSVTIGVLDAIFKFLFNLFA